MFLSNFSQGFKFSIRVKHSDESCPRLSTQTSIFHCCLSQDPSHVSVSSGLLVLGARVRNLLWGIVCPRKLCERESSRSRCDNNSHRCLVLRLVSSGRARSLARACALSFLIFHRVLSSNTETSQNDVTTLPFRKTRYCLFLACTNNVQYRMFTYI